MIFSKSRCAPGMAFAFVMGFAFASQTLPVSSQEQQPTESEQPAPAGPDALPSGGDTSSPAAEPAAPAQDGATAPSAEPTPDGGAAPAEGDTASPPASTTDVAPAEPSAPAAETTAPAPSEGGSAVSVSASQVQIGAAVFGSDGAKIGEINGVKSDDTGKVQQILVTDGMPAGINAKVFEISADKITSVSDGVKLSLSSEDAKKLPIIDNSNG